VAEAERSGRVAVDERNGLDVGESVLCHARSVTQGARWRNEAARPEGESDGRLG
jgi:hypothetical protein